MVLHFHPDRIGLKPITVAQALLVDRQYRSQFETVPPDKADKLSKQIRLWQIGEVLRGKAGVTFYSEGRELKPDSRNFFRHF